MSSVPCYNCGVGIHLDAIPNHNAKLNRVGKFCPVCFAPICETAQANTAHEGANPSDPKDGLRAAKVAQVAADVASMTATKQAE